MIELTADRDAALKAGYFAMLDRMPGVSYDLFRSTMGRFDIKAIQDGPETVGMFCADKNEVHVAIVPQRWGKWLTRTLFVQAIDPLMVQYGRVITAVLVDNAKGDRFVRRLGFKCYGHNDVMRFYSMESDDA